MNQRRVVVTGLGMLTPLGVGCQASWEAMLEGKSGIKKVTHFDVSEFACQIAGLVPEFDSTPFYSAKDVKKMDAFIQYGLVAAIEAVEHSGLDPQKVDPTRVGVSIGSGIGGLPFIEKNHIALNESGPRKISPFFIPGAIINMISGHVSIRYGFKGPNLATVTACTTGTHNIALGTRLIAYGDADVMLVGGAEKASTPLGLGGFAAARALSTRNDDPTKASRPFDKDRDGFVLGDGAGVMILESEEHARARGATILAECVGAGMSGDAFHMTRPTDDGSGAVQAMCSALADAKMTPDAIDHVNAHATSTLAGDELENLALTTTFGNHAKNIAISATKSMTGHLLGAAGAVEAIATVLAIRDQVAPPTINLDNPSEGCQLDYVPHQAKSMTINAALSNSFGFGGTNGSVIFKRYT